MLKSIDFKGGKRKFLQNFYLTKLVSERKSVLLV